MRRSVLLVALVLAGCGEDEAPAPATTGTAPEGRQVFLAQGCGTCHTFAPAGASGTVGPDLGESLKGRADEYVREGIVAPNAATAAGFEDGSGLMPDDYGTRIPAKELDALVEFLTSR